jgi:hypothetical protein
MTDFSKHERLFAELLSAAQVLSDSERAEIQHFIDVGEYGLALETAADIYVEEKKTASAEVLKLFEALANLMLMDSSSILAKVGGPRH